MDIQSLLRFNDINDQYLLHSHPYKQKPLQMRSLKSQLGYICICTYIHEYICTYQKCTQAEMCTCKACLLKVNRKLATCTDKTSIEKSFLHGNIPGLEKLLLDKDLCKL